jgi:adenylate cyclase
LPDKPSLVVLPFQNMSGDPEQEYLADGVVEDITTALSHFNSLFVIARNSAFTYKGRLVDLRLVGRELGVRYILEGSVRKSGGRVRISGQLVQADTGVHLWATRYDRELSDIFALQDEITTSVVSALVPTLRVAEIERARRKPTDSLDAYDLYLRALARQRSLTQEGNSDARRLVEQALTLDQHLVLALLLAHACWAEAAQKGWVPSAEGHARSPRYAQRAAEIAPDDAEVLVTLAHRTGSLNRNYKEAVSIAERAITANPNSASVLSTGGWTLLYGDRATDALDLFERSLGMSSERSLSVWPFLSATDNDSLIL